MSSFGKYPVKMFKSLFSSQLKEGFPQLQLVLEDIACADDPLRGDGVCPDVLVLGIPLPPPLPAPYSSMRMFPYFFPDPYAAQSQPCKSVEPNFRT